MAKFINNRIKSGRVGGSVFAVRKGEVIERAYNPFVTNPSTSAQVEARAKFKLASQVAAALGDDLVGFVGGKPNQSQRNLFTKKLFDDGALTYSGTTATLDLSNVQITNSSLVFGNTGVITSSSSGVSMTIFADPLFATPGSMVYGIVVRPTTAGGLVVVGRNTALVVASGTNFTINTTGSPAANDRVIYFLMRPAGSGAEAAYRNIVGDGTSTVSVEAVRTLIMSGYEVSRSRNATVPAPTTTMSKEKK